MFNKMSKVTKKLLVAAAVGLMAASLFAGCGKDSSSEQKVLRVGAETTFPPFEFSEGDKYVGFDMDLTKAIADKIGYKYEFKSMGFDALIPALQSNDIDMIASGMNATPEREKTIIFSDSYLDEGGFITVVRKDNTTINDMKDLTNHKVGVQIGNVSVDLVSAIPGTELKQVDSNSQMFTELQAGTIDAAVLDTAVAKYYLAHGASKDLKLVGQSVEATGYNMGFRKSDTELRDKVNQALKDLKADGTYQKIYDKWFKAKE